MGWVKKTPSERPDGKRRPGRPRRADRLGTPVGDERYAESLELEKAKIRRKRHLAAIRRDLEKYKGANPSGERIAMVEHMIAEATQDELMRRLDESPEKMSDNALIRLKDSAVNTIARQEQWDKRRGAEPKDALSFMLKRMKELKGKVKLEVSFDEPEPVYDAEIISSPPALPEPPEDPPLHS